MNFTRIDLNTGIAGNILPFIVSRLNADSA